MAMYFFHHFMYKEGSYVRSQTETSMSESYISDGTGDPSPAPSVALSADSPPRTATFLHAARFPLDDVIPEYNALYP